MTDNCAVTHFYAGGVKIPSGESWYIDANGDRHWVVCGTAGDGEINAQELPDGAHVYAPGDGSALELTYHGGGGQGREGRRHFASDYAAYCATTADGPSKVAYLRAALGGLEGSQGESRPYAREVGATFLAEAAVTNKALRRALAETSLGAWVSPDALVARCEGQNRVRAVDALEDRLDQLMPQDTIELMLGHGDVSQMVALAGAVTTLLEAGGDDDVDRWERVGGTFSKLFLAAGVTNEVHGLRMRLAAVAPPDQVALFDDRDANNPDMWRNLATEVVQREEDRRETAGVAWPSGSSDSGANGPSSDGGRTAASSSGSSTPSTANEKVAAQLSALREQVVGLGEAPAPLPVTELTNEVAQSGHYAATALQELAGSVPDSGATSQISYLADEVASTGQVATERQRQITAEHTAELEQLVSQETRMLDEVSDELASISGANLSAEELASRRAQVVESVTERFDALERAVLASGAEQRESLEVVADLLEHDGRDARAKLDAIVDEWNGGGRYDETRELLVRTQQRQAEVSMQLLGEVVATDQSHRTRLESSRALALEAVAQVFDALQ